MAATTITVSQETRHLLELLKSGGQTYDDVIRHHLILHPHVLTSAELYRRAKEPGIPIEELIKRSRRQPF